MIRNQACTHSAPNRGTIPQGKGREGKRKGREAEGFRDVSCGLEGQDRIRSNGDLARRIGLGANK